MNEYWLKIGVKVKFAADLNVNGSEPKRVGDAELFVEIETDDGIVDYPVDGFKDTLSEKELSTLEDFLEAVTEVM